MALRRIGTVFPGAENPGLAAKTAFGKENGRPRAALGDIGNRATAIVGKKAALKVEETKTKRPLGPQTRAKASSALQPVRALGNGSAAIKPSAAKSPEPMDMEEVGQALKDCFEKNIADIDAEDHDNPQLCAEYVNEIYRYMRKLERTYSVPRNYMDKQDDVNPKMRSILVDWLIQVHLRFHLLQETLFMTISILDRFLALHRVPRLELQLVGVSAMLLASKYEEMYAPEIGDFVFITDNAFTKAQIRKMEALIFRTLDFSIGKPLCLHFLRRNSKAGSVDAEKHQLAKYLMELTLVDYESVKFSPSEVAAAALCLSMKAIDNMDWDDTLEHYSAYSEQSLGPCMHRMIQLVENANDKNCKWTAVPKKYAASKFGKVSLLPCLEPSRLESLVAPSC